MVLIGSINNLMLCFFNSYAANFKLSIKVVFNFSGSELFSGIPARHVTFGHSKTLAYSIVRPTPSWNSPILSG